MAKLYKKGFLLKVFFVVLIANSYLYANTDEKFIKASKAFYKEGKVFKGESHRLMNNTQEVDAKLHQFKNKLNDIHKTTQALMNLERTISTIKLGLTAAELIPQTKTEAKALKDGLDRVHNPVSKATDTMKKLDAHVNPLLKQTEKTQKVTANLVKQEKRFRTGGIKYLDGVEKVTKCVKTDVGIKVLTESDKKYTKTDKSVKKINDSYANAKKAPEKVMNEILREIKKIKTFEKPILSLNTKLRPLFKPLNKLKHILDQRVHIKVPYVCGEKICHKKEKYPCGTKTCHKRVLGVKVPYSCGIKYCHKKIPYPCGTKTCHVNISMSVSDIINGSHSIELKLQSMLSSGIYDVLKKVGLKSIIKDLKNRANGMLKPILKELHLNINPKLPELNIDLNANMLNIATKDISGLNIELIKIEKLLKKLKAPTINVKKYHCK